MVFEEAQLVVVGGIRRLLRVERVRPRTQRLFAAQVGVEHLADVVLVLDVERLERLGVGGAVEPGAAHFLAEARVYGLRQPDKAGVDFFHGGARLLPERHRHKGRHVAAEAVHQRRPLGQRLDLVVPERGHGVVEVDHVRPVADVVAGLAVGLFVEELGVRLPQHGVRRGVVVHHVDHHPHPAAVDGVAQVLEVGKRAVGGIYVAIVAVGVGTAEAALLPLLPDGVDGQEPDVVCT